MQLEDSEQPASFPYEDDTYVSDLIKEVLKEIYSEANAFFVKTYSKSGDDESPVSLRAKVSAIVAKNIGTIDNSLWMRLPVKEKGISRIKIMLCYIII